MVFCNRSWRFMRRLLRRNMATTITIIFDSEEEKQEWLGYAMDGGGLNDEIISLSNWDNGRKLPADHYKGDVTNYDDEE